MKKKNLKKVLIGILIFYIAVVATVYALQKYIIFQSVKLDRNFEYTFKNPHEEYFLKTADEVELNVLLFKTQQQRKGLVLYFHGNADNLKRWGTIQEDFVSRGYDIVVSDYRGFGKSTGTSDEQLFYEDAQLIYEWVLEKYTTRLILPFDLKYEFPNHKHLQKITEPVFIFAGTKDRVVPNRSTEKLKPFLKPSDHYIVIEGGGHKNLRNFPKYNQELDAILK